MSSRGDTLRGRKPLMMVEGVPQTNPLRNGDRTALTISPLVLERVEVIHSANSIHGLGASGGTTNLVTKTPEEGLKQTVSLNTNGQDRGSDSFGGGATYMIEASNGKADVLMALNRATSGYYYDVNDDQVGSDTTQGDSQDSDIYNAFIKTGYNLDDGSRLSLTYNYYQKRVKPCTSSAGM